MPTMHRFIRTSWLAALHVAMSFQLIVYAIIKITRRGTTVLQRVWPARLELICRTMHAEHSSLINIPCFSRQQKAV